MVFHSRRAKRLVYLAGIACVLAGHTVGSLNASPVTWQVSVDFPGLGLAPGGSASGSFTYDADTNSLATWNIAVTGFSFPAVEGLLTPASSSLQLIAPTDLRFAYSSNEAFLALFFLDPLTLNPLALTNAGGRLQASGSLLYASPLGQLSWGALDRCRR